MTTLELIPGGGRLCRNQNFVAFCVAPLAGVTEIVEGDESAFKALAGLVVAGDFAVAPFVVIDLRDRRVFLFGDLTLQLQTGEVLNGATSSTWVERILTEEELSGVCTPGVQSSASSIDRTDLQLGCVPAGGFRFGTAQEQPESELTSLAAAAPNPIPSPAEPTPTDSAEDEAKPAPDHDVSVEAPDGDDSEATSDVKDPGGSAEHPDGDEPDDLELDPSWDPLAEPESVDLSAIGQPASTTPEPENTDLDEGEPPHPSDPVDPAHPADQARHDEPLMPEPPEEALGPDETIFETHTEGWSPPAAPTSTGLGPPSNAPASLRARPPAPPSNPRSSPPPPVPITSSDGMIELDLDRNAPPPPPPIAPGPAPTAGSRIGGLHGTLLFDDGQRVPVDEGIYVGRFPTKHGVPDGYEAVVIRSEEVSRLHWELVVEHDRVFVQDLGSQNGTALENSDGQPGDLLPANELSEIQAGTTISFGDRWARFEA